MRHEAACRYEPCAGVVWVSCQSRARSGALVAVGPANAPDLALMVHAREHGQIVLTHDLDFGAILATTSASGPSVIQIRAPEPSIESCGNMVLTALQQFEDELCDGAIVTVTQETARATVLPLQQRKGNAP